MNGTTLIWSALRRHKARTIFTFLSVTVAFVLFSVLAAVRYGMLGQVEFSSAERLITNNKVSQGNALPLSYYNKIVTVPGVTAVAYLNGFNGYYKVPKNNFQVLVFSPTVFDVFREAYIPPQQMQTWRTDQQGVIVGPDLAKHMGWKVGETIPVQSKVPQKDGSTTWYFHLNGIYHADLPTHYQNFFIAHYQYFNQGVASSDDQNLVFQFFERVDDARHVDRISRAIDALFASDTPQTQTQSAVEEAISIVRQFGNISAMVIYVGIAVFFTMLLIIGNTMAQSVRERTGEFAMFRALGFKRFWLVWLVIVESLLLVVAGGVFGLILGDEVTKMLAPTVQNLLQTFQLTWAAISTGILLSILFGLLAALVPVQRIAALRVADALRWI